MGKGAPSAPAPPDPAATAAAQGAANKEAAIANATINMVNQQTPYGTLTYNQIGEVDGTPRYEAVTQLTPEQLNLLNQQTQGQTALNQLGLDQLGRINASVADPFSYAGLPDAPVVDEAYRTSVENALYDRLNPQLDRDRAMLEQQLANQGITMGSAAYTQAIDADARARNDARLAITAQGGNEAARQFQLAQAARQQGIQERAYLRDRPLAEMSAFMSGGQPQLPQFANVPQSTVQPTDVIGPTYANYQGQLANYNQQMGARNSQMGALAGFAGSALGGWGMGGFKNPFSDRRLKTDIRRVGQSGPLGVYEWTYIWGEKGRGYMADEVKRVRPEAVGERHGFQTVNYELLGGIP